ncbi:hypothetical protein NP493_269g01021 [Ridgeia piscesae]|uniref:Uncharacterized protein n=1 Tax=Ridgeia piscesae TaxID=27915 RepID=A0AAD9NXL9_RIDPI|nr:hypothetical protein NP493_269g01021 [Ridgeia piscesae]
MFECSVESTIPLRGSPLLRDDGSSLREIRDSPLSSCFHGNRPLTLVTTRARCHTGTQIFDVLSRQQWRLGGGQVRAGRAPVSQSRTDGPPSRAADRRQCYLSAGVDITAPTTAVGNRRAALSRSAGVVIISRKATVPFARASFYESLSNKSVKSVRFGGGACRASAITRPRRTFDERARLWRMEASLTREVM